MCTHCFVGHHEECWNRNGRCSTFRCRGTPQLLLGSQYSIVLADALEKANAAPNVCPLCGGEVYAGRVYIRRTMGKGENPVRSLLVFQVREAGSAASRGASRGLFGRLLGARRWNLLGAQMRARSCGSCRTLFLWGMPVDDGFAVTAQEQARDRYCVHCGTPMAMGELQLREAKFWCDTVPNFHSEWILHHLLDRFVYNRWPVQPRSIPAASCSRCHYTEISGRPVYRLG